MLGYILCYICLCWFNKPFPEWRRLLLWTFWTEQTDSLILSPKIPESNSQILTPPNFLFDQMVPDFTENFSDCMTFTVFRQHLVTVFGASLVSLVLPGISAVLVKCRWMKEAPLCPSAGFFFVGLSCRPRPPLCSLSCRVESGHVAFLPHQRVQTHRKTSRPELHKHIIFPEIKTAGITASVWTLSSTGRTSTAFG